MNEATLNPVLVEIGKMNLKPGDTIVLRYAKDFAQGDLEDFVNGVTTWATSRSLEAVFIPDSLEIQAIHQGDDMEVRAGDAGPVAPVQPLKPLSPEEIRAIFGTKTPEQS